MMTALRVNPVVVSMELPIANVRDLVLEYRVYFPTTAHRMNIVALTKYVAQIVLENLVCGMATAHQENPVVVWMELLVANALDLVLKNHVKMIPTADQTSIVVIVVKVLLVTVLNLVLENRAYFETRTGLGLGPGLGLEENPDSRKTRTRTRKKSGLVFNKTRT